jgi:uncharacterized protein DUF4826
VSDYDDPVAEAQWFAERRAEVTAYLQRERVDHGRVGERPAWHIAPYVSVWTIESKQSPRWVGWWVICGDVPTDYVSATTIKHPRDAVRAIAQEWREQARLMANADGHPDTRIGRVEDRVSLALLLATRASTLLDLADDDCRWEGAG